MNGLANRSKKYRNFKPYKNDYRIYIEYNRMIYNYNIKFPGHFITDERPGDKCVQL